MSDQRQKQIFIGVGVIIVVLLALFIRSRSAANDIPTVQGAGIYYAGAKRSKNNPNIWIDINGKIVPPPPGTKPVNVPARSGGGGE